MAGFNYGRAPFNQAAASSRQYIVGLSQQIVAGDVVVLTGVGGVTRVRKLTAADITNNFTESAVIKGILGIAAYDVATDANGVLTVPATPSYIAGGTRIILPLPSYGAGIDVDPVSGSPRLSVFLADASNEFLARVAGAANAAVTVNSALQEIGVGIQVVNTTDFNLNTAATGAGICAFISGMDEQDINFNVNSVQCRAFVRFLPAYQQSNTNVLYVA